LGSYALRLPEPLKQAAKRIAAADDTTMNQFFVVAIAEEISATETADFVERRSAAASKTKADKQWRGGAQSRCSASQRRLGGGHAGTAACRQTHSLGCGGRQCTRRLGTSALIAIDTNVILRFLTRQPKAQFETARDLFRKGGLFVSTLVVMEAYFTLTGSILAFAADHALDALDAVLRLPGLEVQHADEVFTAMA
jgi:hypothetical protein